MSGSTLFRARHVVTFDPAQPVVDHGGVLVEDGRIVAVGPGAALAAQHPESALQERGEAVLMPGMVNAHMHLYGSLARGMDLKGPPPRDFVQILEKLWWRLDRQLDAESVRASAMVGLLDSLSAGVTTLFDHHASPRCAEGSLDTIEECVAAVGMRGVLCYESTDRDGPQVREAGLRENLRYLAKEKPHGRMAAAYGLHASFTVRDETLDRVAEDLNSRPEGVHIHLLEDRADRTVSMESYGASPVERLARRGLLRETSLLAHGVHLTENEASIVAEAGAVVLHNPASNLNNGVGAASLAALTGAGVRTALGTDGFTASMLDEHTLASILARHVTQDPGAGWDDAVQLLTQRNPDLASAYLGVQVGRLARGYEADLVAVDYDPPTPLNEKTLGGHLLFGLARAPVLDVWVGGEEVYRDGAPTRVDRRREMGRAREAAKALWSRF